MNNNGPIGVFDSGYGGLTVLKQIRQLLPDYDYLYLGDNARNPYGSRSFDVVYQYTLQAVEYLFEQGCPLVILACNTASAKALRNIQQKDLINIAPDNRVLGVLRPTTEEIGHYTKSNHIGILGTVGTVKSNSYQIEINNFFPQIKVTQKSCSMWVPLIENNEYNSKGGEYFIKKYIDEILTEDPEIDTLVLACTHYPLIEDKINCYLPSNVRLLSQGKLVAEKLKIYLERHPEINQRLKTKAELQVYTTENNIDFNQRAMVFYPDKINAKTISFT